MLIEIGNLIKIYMPWYVKLIMKLVLSRLPTQRTIWQILPLMRHSAMLSPEYAYSIFTKHFNMTKNLNSFVCMELGPGESLFNALIAKAFGAKKVLLVDVKNCAIHKMSLYRDMYLFLIGKGHKLTIDLSNFKNLMHSCGAVYLTSGLDSLRQIPDKSIDFVFSNAVLEHIRKQEFILTLEELARILKPEGISTHIVDLRDHLSDGLNSLRFSDLVWESDWFVNSGFYTNRIRFCEMVVLLERAGF
ncbi:hypothetical protein A2Y85_02625, partial [candidate division WOR-3 bacterium RBG_13_43_14]